MAEDLLATSVPIPDKVLRGLAKNVANVLPKFPEEDDDSGVKNLLAILAPVLETADLPDLEPSHRAAASNALCAIIEHCQASDTERVRNAILDDAVWVRLFEIYLQRSGDAKGKSMRQMLLVLTSVITKNQSLRALELREWATASFLDIICQRQDRIKVKPALQGLAHFLLRDVVSIAQLVALYDKLVEHPPSVTSEATTSQTVFKAFLAWVVHHDTALSAGHLIKNFLIQARRLPHYGAQTDDVTVSPLWVEPVVHTLCDWPDRIQEFKTHVFPHCFLPNIDEYLRFLSYLHFNTHVQPKGTLPGQLCNSSDFRNGLDGPEEFRILLAAIASGKELTIVRDNGQGVCSTIEVRDGALYLPDDILGTWMSHSEPEVRLAGMFLSVYSISVTRPISGDVLKALNRNLVHLHTDTDANFRREVHGYTQKLFDRLRSSTATSAKAKSRVVTSSQSRFDFPKADSRQEASLLKQSRQESHAGPLAFVVWYLRFLEWELRPTASYQRRITALRSLVIVLRSGVDPGVPHSQLSKSAQGQLNWAHGLQVANATLTRTLLDLILDPFDDVRDAAVSVLQLCLVALPHTEKDAVLAMIPRFISRAEATMLRTGRADQADGVARAYGMIFSLASNDAAELHAARLSSKIGLFEHLKIQLEETLTIAHSNLSEAVNGRPVHGTFAALRYVVDQHDFYPALSNTSQETSDQWRELHTTVVASIESLWSCVHHVLCADAPEGHVPDELEEDVSLDTKEILSYSWRGLKEASVLLRVIISKAPIGHGDRYFVSPELFERLGWLCFTQLLELRHRGAFSTVSQTFAAFCRRCVASDVAALRALPETWYQETLRSIQDKADAITRRSAGIPALMSALLAAEPQPGGDLFPRAINGLTAETLVEARSANIEESRLPQVHALNCIKEIFTTSRLSVASEAYIGQGLELAARTLNSNIWPIRNCSLMLFKALIERLLGSDEAQDWKERERAKTSRFSYDNYPSLVNILSDLLDPRGPLKQSIERTPDSSSPLDLHGAEGVFPALQILRQARPPEANLGPIISSVSELLASPHWHLRDMAARTVVSLRSTPQLYSAAVSILDTVLLPHNRQHGALLAVKHIFRKLLGDSAQLALQDFDKLMKELSNFSQSWYVVSDCPFVRSAFLDIVSLCGMSMLCRTDAHSTLHTWEDLTRSISIGPQHILGVSDSHNEALLRISLAQVFFIDRVIVRDDALGFMVSSEYQGIGDALMLLATEDPDTCCAVLETLDAILQLRSSNGLNMPLPLISAHIHRIILDVTDAEVISKAQSVLAGALVEHGLKMDFLGLMTKDQILDTLEKLETQCLEGPPSNVQSALHLLGFFLDFAYNEYPDHQLTTLKAIARYIRLLRMTIVDTNPFDTRFAAIQSVSALEHIWTANPACKTTAPLILALSFVLYDLLNDDDDEIRDLAALATGKLFRAQGRSEFKDTVPILTTHRLATFLSTAFLTSSHLLKEASRRLTNARSLNPLFFTPFGQVFAEERKEDTALFAQEKQNLYKDDTLDAVLWSRALTTIPFDVHTQDVSTGLATWVLDGLAVLSETARMEVDGALGWSSKSEIFTLGMRVFCAAEVVLSWRTGHRGEIMRALREFADVGEKAEVQGLWLQKIEGVLKKEVLGTLVSVKGSLLKLGE